MKKTIFIQITCYQDNELVKTIQDAVEKSSDENHLIFGVHAIHYDDDTSWIDPIRKVHNIKIFESKAPQNIGMGVGRFFAHQFYRGEDYYFQIDAHSRFDQDWDKFLIEEIERHKANGFKKPVITQYPKPYWYEGDEEKTNTHEEVVTQFYWKDPHRFDLYRTPMQGTIKNPEGNIHSISVSGGCIFVEGKLLDPNQSVFADGEEIVMAARLYTHGYDLFVPSKMFMYHLYFGNKGKNWRRTVYQDFPDETIRLEKISKEEIWIVLSGEGTTGEHRLGTERTLAEYGQFAGLDFKNGKVLDNYTA